MDDQLKAIHLSGWLKPDHMSDHPETWLNTWFENAKEAEQNDCELVVFKIPLDQQHLKRGFRTTNTDAVSYIERYLQENFPIPKK